MIADRSRGRVADAVVNCCRCSKGCKAASVAEEGCQPNAVRLPTFCVGQISYIFPIFFFIISEQFQKMICSSWHQKKLWQKSMCEGSNKLKQKLKTIVIFDGVGDGVRANGVVVLMMVGSSNSSSSSSRSSS